MSKQAAAQHAIIEASVREQVKPPAFLNTWKNALHLAGVEYLNVTTDTVGQATEKFQLVPDLVRMFDTGLPRPSWSMRAECQNVVRKI